MAKKLAFDRFLFTSVIVLTGLGLAMVYSASAVVAGSEGFNPFLRKQALAAALGLGAMLGLMHLDYRHLKRPAVIHLLLLGALTLLVAALFAPELNGTRRWLFLGGLSFQPSELAKPVLVAYLAYQIARQEERERDRDLLLPSLLVTGLVTGLVLLGPDLGTAVLLGAVALLMLILAGLPWRYLGIGGAVLVPVLSLLILAADYRKERLVAFLDPERDPLGSGFQAIQSLIAVGSGGVLGRGLGNSLQKLFFLPHPHSDFIFAIVAEELGLVGALTVLLLFAVVLWRGTRAGVRAPDAFGSFLAWGLTGTLVAQALINVSVAVVLFPTTGIPLPFLSYGGSSLLVSLAMCGVLLNVSEHG